ncbi:MAG: hypothetical protein WCA59_12305 [Candidatus Binataceae bacterium]
MRIKPARTKVDYERALQEIESMWGAKEGTPQGNQLDVLATLVEAYERKHFPIDPPGPIEAIRFRLEQQGLDPRALIGVIGGRGRVHEVMHGQRGAVADDDPASARAFRHSGRSADSPRPYGAPPARSVAAPKALSSDRAASRSFFTTD